jgi:hypothetical protein
MRRILASASLISFAGNLTIPINPSSETLRGITISDWRVMGWLSERFVAVWSSMGAI